MSGFERHNIKHTSPSSINLFSAAPCAWVARYLFDKKFSFSLAAKAGTIVEDAIVSVLLNGVDAAVAIDSANKEYTKACAFGCSDADRKRGEAISGMIEGGLDELAQYGTPEMPTDIIYGKKQKKIELLCNGDGWKLPVIGYLDLHYPQHGLIIDIKTTMRAPSSLSDEHARQGAVYRASMGNAAVKFLYLTGKKTVVLEVDDPAPILADVKTILNRQERLLRLDASDILSIIPVVNSFYWEGNENVKKELYGL